MAAPDEDDAPIGRQHDRGHANDRARRISAALAVALANRPTRP
jgi:hypothetical protein